jgi:GxxExxY protein
LSLTSRRQRLVLTAIAAPVADHPALDETRAAIFIRDRLVGVALAAFFTVHRELGTGFADVVYRRALALELQQRGIQCEQAAAIGVFYKGAKVGQYTVDLIVEGRIVVQVRGDAPGDWDATRLPHLLRRSGCSAALLLIFGSSPVFRHVAAAEAPE